MHRLVNTRVMNSVLDRLHFVVLNHKRSSTSARLNLDFSLFSPNPEKPNTIVVNAWMRNLELLYLRVGVKSADSFKNDIDVARHG